MASEFTEDRPLPPSERRRERARRSGHVPISHDLVAAAMLGCACVALAVLGKPWWGRLTAYTRVALASAPTARSIEQHIGAAWALAAGVLGWPLLLIFVGGLAAGLGQARGWAFPARHGGGSSWSLSRGGLPWRERLAEAAFAFCKLALLTAVAVATLVPALSALATLPRATATQTMGALLALGERLGVRLVVAMVALGFVDYVWRLVRYRRRLRMTHEEARREQRETEGDPGQKMERQRLHRELQAQAEPSAVGNARLLLVDPGRAAAAVAWSDLGDAPPLVTVRGEGLRARAMETTARATGVPVCLDPALVRGLAGVAEGAAVPEGLLGALARAGARARGRRASPVAKPGGAGR